jgi:CBS domain containing-hemolysin-like protein
MNNDDNLKNTKNTNKKIKNKKRKNIMPEWLGWGLTVIVFSFALTVIFSFLTEISIKNSPAFVCIIVLILLLVINISCDVLANAIISCLPDSFHAMASNKIRGAKRAVTFCKNATKLGSVFADVIGDICGIVSGASGAALVMFIAKDGGTTTELIASIGVNAVIGALTVGGKAIFKHFAIKYNKQIVFGFARFTTFFKREK